MKKRIVALLLVFVLCIGSFTGCGKAKPTDVAVLIGDIEITREELLFYLAYYEVLGNMAATYSGMDSETFWNSKNEDNEINREVYYTTAFAELSYMTIMSKLAEKENFKLTDEQIANAHADAKEFFEDFSPEEQEKTGITLHGFEVALERQLLVTMFEQVFVKKLSVDPDKIREKYKAEDYKCKETEFIGYQTTKLNAKGETESIPADEIEKAKEAMKKALELIKAGKTFAEAATELKNELTLVTTTKYIYDGSPLEEAYLKAAENLENDQFTDIVEGTEGLYIIRMIDTDSPDYFDRTVNNAIEAEEKTEMTKYYETLAATYSRTIKDSIVSLDQFGSYFIINAIK